MNQVKLPHNFDASETTSTEAATPSGQVTTRWMRLGLVTALGVGLAFCPPLSPHAQRVKERAVKVTRVASSTRGKDGIVSISADGNLNRAQTWQDREGFHVVFPHGQTEMAQGAPRGVKVRRVGNSLEFVVPVKPGSSVTVQPRFNRLDLVVGGGLASSSSEESDAVKRPRESSVARRARNEAPQRERQDSARERSAAQPAPSRREKASDYVAALGRQLAAQPAANTVAAPSAQTLNSVPAGPVSTVPAVPAAAVPEAASNAALGAQNPGLIYGTAEQSQAPGLIHGVTEVQDGSSGKGGSSFLSLSGLLMLFGVLMLGAAGFVLLRRRMTEDGEGEASAKKEQKTVAASAADSDSVEQHPFEQYKGDRRKNSVAIAQDRRKGNAGAELLTHQLHPSGALVPESGAEKPERRGEGRGAHPSAPSVLFGAYRIDQEVAKLAQGEAHSIDVLASRASDDRRAIETSLIKIIQSPIEEEDAKRRARAALEEYGFVARQSAALLLATEAYDRVSAARILGQVKSASTLPFLLEALYDTEQVVRTEVVASLGALALPRAIGALLDLARRYPEIPASLIGSALTACSVESLEASWGDGGDGRAFALTGSIDEFTGEIVRVEPAAPIEPLPEWLEDETLAATLELLEDVDVEARVAAAQSLALFPARRAVEALSAMAQHDASPAVRGAAVTSLGQIDHESVFAPVLVAMADEAREVRAAAARALSGLYFERADAYVRVIETADVETLHSVARACLKAGLAAQAVNRLASEDRRQAYESFTLLSLVARAGETQFILEAIEKHSNINVRLAAVRLLRQGGEPEVMEQLRELAGHGGVPEELRSAILETAHRPGQLEAEVA